MSAPQPRLDPDTVARLVKLLGMCGSAFEGERANAAALADQFLRQRGLTWREVIVAATADDGDVDWRVLRDACLQRRFWLREREFAFLTSLADWRGDLTEKQRGWLAAIHARVCRQC